MRVFVGGATGATGQDFVRIARDRDLDLVVQVRPRSEDKYRLQQPSGPEPTLLDLGDRSALVEAMKGCTAVASMIGTMRKRFDSGDTYAASDIGSTQQLVDAAKEAGVDRFVLMGAQGTSWIPGPYYDAKREAEAILFRSGLSWTVLRPGALVGKGRGHRLLSAVGVSTEACARAMVRAATEPGFENRILGNGDIKRLGG